MTEEESWINRKEFDACSEKVIEDEMLYISKHYRIEEALDDVLRSRRDYFRYISLLLFGC